MGFECMEFVTELRLCERKRAVLCHIVKTMFMSATGTGTD